MHTDESRRHSAGFLTAFQFRPCGYRHSEGRTQHTASRYQGDSKCEGYIPDGNMDILQLFLSHSGGRDPVQSKLPHPSGYWKPPP